MSLYPHDLRWVDVRSLYEQEMSFWGWNILYAVYTRTLFNTRFFHKSNDRYLSLKPPEEQRDFSILQLFSKTVPTLGSFRFNRAVTWQLRKRTLNM